MVPSSIVTAGTGAAVIFLLAVLPTTFHKAGWIPTEAPGHALLVSKGCAACHMEGSSQIAPTLHGLFGANQPLADGQSVLVDEEYLRESILHPQAKIAKGFPPSMPSYEGRLTPEEVTELIGYIRSIGALHTAQ